MAASVDPADTKYGDRITSADRFRWRHDRPIPALSRHLTGDEDLQGRWDARMPADAIGPAQALVRATPDTGIVTHPHFETAAGNRPEVVWLYRGRTSAGADYGAVLIEADDTIVTAYRLRSIPDAAVRAYLATRRDQDGGIVDE